MITKHNLQLGQPVRPFVAPLPPASAAALVASKMPPPSDKKTSAKKPPAAFSDKKTSAKKPPVVEEFVNYEMTDTEYDSGSDDESETGQNFQKAVPEWARSKNLLNALEHQYSPNCPIDPDEYFGQVESCNLEAIFNKKSSKYRRRNSSGDWTKDRVTDEEKRVYKLAAI